MAARDPPPTESMVPDQEAPAPAFDRQPQARLVGAVLGYPRSRALLANLLLGGDVGHLTRASKSAFKLLVLRLPAILEIFTFRSIVRPKLLDGSTKSVLKVLNEPTPGKPISKTAVFFQCLADWLTD